MTRREIVRAAKNMVAHHGPYNVLEFGEEILRDNTPRDLPEWIHREAILEEAGRQADRVLDFLGL